MLILLYGKDTYRSTSKLKEIVEGYKKKCQSGLNIKFLDEKESFKDLQDVSKQVSMFGEKRFFVIPHAFSCEKMKSEIIKNCKNLSQAENIFLIYEQKEVKKQDKLLKTLLKEEEGVMLQEFLPLTGKKLYNWVVKEFEKNNTEVEKDAVESLQRLGGENLWRIKSEIDKLSLYKNKISKEDVSLMVNIDVDANIFNTVDAIAENNNKKALTLLHDHLQKGDNPLYVLSMIAYQMRNLIIIKDLEDRKHSYEEARKKSKMHPFVFGKSYNQAKKFSLEEIKRRYEMLFDIDLKVKTGQVSPEMAIHLFLFS
jgi:DNA polymerase III subunit delta